MELNIKRIYDPADKADGFRVLVDRLWPRGISKERAELDEWLKEIAPSTELRESWEHDPNTMGQFAVKYRHELDANPAVQTLLDAMREHPTVTLLYAAKDPAVNHALILQQYMKQLYGRG